MGDPNPMRDVRCPAASVASLNAAGATLGKNVLVDVSLRIDEGNYFIVWTSVTHGLEASTKLGRVRLRGVAGVVASYSTHRSGTVPPPSVGGQSGE
jgi:hypothetical protein